MEIIYYIYSKAAAKKIVLPKVIACNAISSLEEKVKTI